MTKTILAKTALTFVTASGLFAQATYTYAGSTFSSFARGTVPASDHISVSFILASALSSNITAGTEVYPVAWTISDGVSVISSSNPSSFTVPASFVFTTDATGKMTSWQVVGYGSGGVSISTCYVAFGCIEDTSQYNNSAGQQVGAGGVLGDPGTWTSTITIPAPAEPSLIVSPASLAFSVQVGDSGAVPQTIDVNSSGTPITFIVSATSQGNWLTVAAGTPVSPFGSWQATTPASVSVFVDPAQLAKVGSYTGTITITSAGAINSPRSIAVTLNVASASSISVTPPALSFSATVGAVSPSVQTVNISLVPPDSLLPPPTAAVLTGNSWLSVRNSTSNSFSVSAKPTGLAAGLYSGSIVVSVVGASSSPLTLLVSLTITAPPSSLVASPPEAFVLSHAGFTAADRSKFQRLNRSSKLGSSVSHRHRHTRRSLALGKQRGVWPVFRFSESSRTCRRTLFWLNRGFGCGYV